MTVKDGVYLACRMFELAYDDLKSSGNNYMTAVKFFVSGQYEEYADLTRYDKKYYYKKFYDTVNGTDKYRRYLKEVSGSYQQLELFT